MTAPAFGWTGVLVVAVYAFALLVVGAFARRARRNESMGDFYLAGRTLGPFVLFATLYATQYSGNSFLGYPGEAYRVGFPWIMSVGFMMAIIAAYLLIAPALHRASRHANLVTPGDWLDLRYGSRSLSVVANLVFVAAISNYLLAQLMAMGHVIAGLSGGQVPYWAGVVGLTAVILVYETLGGMRAVAWTDAVQGGLMLLGLGGILATIVPSPSHMAAVTTWIADTDPAKVAVPDWTVCATWASTLMLVGVSGSVYPHAIQRIYAARSAAALKRSISIMAFMPMVTMTPLVLIGLISLQELRGLEGVAADQVMPMMLAHWSAASPWLYAASLAVMLAAVAAIMSTADSVLLTLSSILAKDFVGKMMSKAATDARLTKVGKICSWLIVGGLLTLALVPRITLWGLTELKMELLMQVSPAFILGLRWPAITGRAVLAGMIAGLAVSFALPLTEFSRPLGLHDGTIGFAVNLLVCVGLSAAAARPTETMITPQATLS